MQAFLALALVAAASGAKYDDFSFSISPASGTEGETLTFLAVVSHGTANSYWSTAADGPQFSYTTVDGTAIHGEDYTKTEGTLSFPSDTSSQKISVTTIQDSIVEATETFSLSVTLDAAGDFSSNNFPTLASNPLGIIEDDEDLTIELFGAQATEGADEEFTFSVVLSHAVDAAFRFSIFADQVGGKAVLGKDFELQTSSLLLEAGKTNASFTVAVLDDDIQEDVETFEVSLSVTSTTYRPSRFANSVSKATGKFLAENEGVTLCIDDSDGKEEVDGFVEFTVKLSHQVDTTVEATYKVIAGSAQPITHYVDLQSTVSIAPLKTSSNPIKVLTVNDNRQSPHTQLDASSDYAALTFQVEVAIDHAVYSGSTGSAANAWKISTCNSSQVAEKDDNRFGFATGSIIDDEGVTVMFEAVNASHSESSNNEWTFSVTLSHSLETNSGLEFSFVDLNPEPTADSIGATVKYGGDVDCDKLPGYGSPNMPTTGPADVCFPFGMIPLNKNNGLDEGADDASVHLLKATSPVPWSYTLEMVRGPEDHIIEGPETFTVGIKLNNESALGFLIKPADNSVLVDDVITAVGSVEDDEKPSTAGDYWPFIVTQQGNVLSGPEAVGAVRYVEVSLSHTAARDIELPWYTSSGTATGNTDFAVPVSPALKWSAFARPGSKAKAVVQVVNDNIQEHDETFSIILKKVQNSMFTTKDLPFVATITDSEDVTVRVSDMTAAMDESVVDWPFTVTVSHSVDFNFDLDYQSIPTTLGGNAVDASRYDGTKLSLTVPARSQKKGFSISVINDDIQSGAAGSVQSFAVELTADPTSIINMEDSKTVGHVLVSDDEGVKVRLVPTASAAENSTSKMFFNVILTHKVDQDVSVAYSAVANNPDDCTTGCASPLDFQAVNGGSLVIPKMKFGADIQIKILNDNVQEFPETFQVKLDGNVKPATITVDQNSKTSVGTISDFEKGEIALFAPLASVSEGDEMKFEVTLSHESDADIHIVYRVTGIEAEEGVDFTDATPTTTEGYLVIPAGSKSAHVVLDIINDNLSEYGERVQVFILNMVAATDMSPYTVKQGSATAEGMIGDSSSPDEDLTLIVTPPPSDAERGTNLVFTISLSHAIAEDVTGAYATVGGTAVAGSDFDAVSNQLRFVANNNEIPDSQTVLVKTRTTKCQEQQVVESMKLKVSAKDVQDRTVVGSILPFDHHPTVVMTDSSSNEGENMIFTVRLSHCVDADVSARFESASNVGSLVQAFNDDFTLPDDLFVTLAASAGDPAQTTFAVYIENNDVQDVPKSFSLKLKPPFSQDLAAGNAGSYNINIIQTSVIGTIADDEDVTLMVIASDGTEGVVEHEPTTSNPDFKFTVVLSHSVASGLFLNYATSDVTASAGVDYLPGSGRVVFPGSSTDTKPNPQFITIEGIVREDVVRPTSATGIPAPTRFALTLAESDDSNVIETYGITMPGEIIGAISSSDSTFLHMKRVSNTEGSEVTVTASLSNEVATDVVLSYKIVASTSSTNDLADVADDMDSQTGTVTFAKNSGVNQSQSFTLMLTDDFLVEKTEVFDIEWEVVEPAGYAQVIDVTTKVEKDNTILDNDLATVMILDSEAYEDSTSMSFTVRLSHFAYDPVTVIVTSNAGLCAETHQACVVTGAAVEARSPDSDVKQPVAQTVTFDGVTAVPDEITRNDQTVFVTLLNDDVLEPAETFTMTAAIQNSANLNHILNASGHKLTGTGTILDDEGAMYIFNGGAGGESKNEGETFSFTVSLTHAVSTGVKVDYSIAEEDCEGKTSIVCGTGSGSFTLTEGMPETFFDIPTTDDEVYTPVDVEFRVNMAKTTPPMIITGATAEGTIVDDNEGTQLFIECAAQVESADAHLSFSVSLSHELSDPMTVHVWTFDIEDEAKAGEDYTAVDEVLTFTGKAGAGETKVQKVQIHEDNIVERDESVGFRVNILTNKFKDITVNHTVVGVAGYSAGVIVESIKPEVTLQKASVVEEDGAEMVFTAFLSHEVGSNTEFVMTYTTSPYAGDGDEHQPFDKPTQIVDDDGLATTRSGQDFTSAKGARSGAFTSAPGVCPDDVNGSPRACAFIRVPISDDDIVELQEKIQLEVLEVSFKTDAYSMKGGVTKVLGTIADNEGATITVTDVDTHSEENNQARLTVVLSHLVQPKLSVAYYTQSAVATSEINSETNSNRDFTHKEGQVYFAGAFSKDGEGRQKQTIVVEIHDDFVAEESIEEFFVILESAQSTMYLEEEVGIQADPVRGVGIVLLTEDEEAATVYVESDASNVEGQSMEFVIVLSHSVQMDAGVKVGYTLDHLTTANGDYSCPNGCTGSVTFESAVQATDHRSQPIVIHAEEDDIEEYWERFEFKLTEINDGAASIAGIAGSLAIGEKTLSISNTRGAAHGTIRTNNPLDDVRLGEITILPATADESDQYMEFDVHFPRHLAGHEPITEEVSFTWRTSTSALPGGGSETARGAINLADVAKNTASVNQLFDERFDYVQDAGAVTMDSRTEKVTLKVKLVDNSRVQGPHSFTVTVLSKYGSVSATGTITETDTSTIRIDDMTVAEMAGAVGKFPVTLSAPVDTAIAFDYDISRSSGNDVESGTATFSIQAGETSGTIEVNIIDDAVQEDTEEFIVTGAEIKFPNGNAKVAISSIKWADNTATGRITDNEDVTVSVAPSFSVTEGANATAVMVSLSHAVDMDVTRVNYMFTHVNTNAADLAINDTGIATFARSNDPENLPTARVVIDVANDNIAELDETFRLTLASTSSNIHLADEKVCSITILNDDVATLSIEDAQHVEEQGTDSTMYFTVTLSHQLDTEIRVNAKTVNSNSEQGFQARAAPSRTATGHYDYIMISDTKVELKNNGKVNTVQIPVTVFDDFVQECNEDFLLELFDPICGPPGTAQECGVRLNKAASRTKATGALINDDEGTTLAAVAKTATMVEGETFTFDVKLSHRVSKSFQFRTFITASDTSWSRLNDCTGALNSVADTSEGCRTATSVTHTVPEFESIAYRSGDDDAFFYTTSVPTSMDDIAQGPGSFRLTIADGNSGGGKAWQCGGINFAAGPASISDDEEATIKIESSGAFERGDHKMSVTLSHAIELPLEIGFEVQNADQSDFTSTTGKINFEPSGVRTSTARVEVLDEEVIESNETYTVGLTNVPDWLKNTGSELSAKLTIYDDEVKKATVSVEVSSIDASTFERKDGSTVSPGDYVVFAISLENENEVPVVFEFETVSGDAKAGDHFIATTGDIQFGPGNGGTQYVVVKSLTGSCAGSLDMQLKLSNLGKFQTRFETIQDSGAFFIEDSNQVQHISYSATIAYC